MTYNPTGIVIPEPVLDNSFLWEPQECPRIETAHRRIQTRLPLPETVGQLRAMAQAFPQVNCYQPPVVWDRAEGYQIYDAAGNCWIDFSSTAVVTNTGHGHRAIREALRWHVETGLLAQFSFASEIRLALAEKLLDLAPPPCDKVYFWTVGSEAIECALRVARIWGMRQRPDKWHVVAHGRGFHGWTLGAHQLSGDSARKPWLPSPDAGIHHWPPPYVDPARAGASPDGESIPIDEAADWDAVVTRNLDDLAVQGVHPEQIAAVFLETVQGWGAVPLPIGYVQALRRWADEYNVLLVFDEMQTGFGRTGRLFGFEHCEVQPDLICVGKGITSGLPLAAVIGRGDVLDVIPPGEITTTHAAHPLSCAAALANLQTLLDERLIEAAATKGELLQAELEGLRRRFPDHIAAATGRGLVRGLHLRDPETGQPDRVLARDLTWEAVKRGVMLFFTNQPTIKTCPPLVIPEDAIREGVATIADALADLAAAC